MECIFTCVRNPFEGLAEYDSYEYCVPDYPVIELVLHSHDLGDTIDAIDASGEVREDGRVKEEGEEEDVPHKL
jgi:hypothetical protein